MRPASLLVVFLLAKWAVVWGHAVPWSVWTPAAFVWQDAAVAVMFALAEWVLRARWPATALYWALVLYAAINIPVGRVVATPLTWPMLRAARGPLADSMLLYVTWANCVLIALTIAAAWLLPTLLTRVPRTAMRIAIASVLLLALMGPAASARVDTHGLDRNPIAVLVEGAWPIRAAHASTGDWRTSRYPGAPAEDLTRFKGVVKGRNVIVVSLESTAAQYLALYGSAFHTMPNLGALARHALVFENAYAVYPESIKGLHSVICSEYPSFRKEAEAYANSGCRSMAAVLGDTGYRTAMFHSGRFAYLGMESVIRNRGFGVLEDAGDIGGNRHSSFGVDEPATVTRMLAWIDGLARGEHFFLTYLPIAGHHPYSTPSPGPFAVHDEIDLYRNALHFGDESLGALMAGLRARGLEQNTLWVIYGDHGEAFRQHDGNYGHTFFLYDENVRVPLVIAAPGAIDGEVRVQKPVSLIDIAPTLLDMLGEPVPPSYQGHSMLSGAARMSLFFTDYSLGILGLRDGRWKFLYERNTGRRKLFDIESDPGEQRDVAESDAERVAWYTGVVRGWIGDAVSASTDRAVPSR